MHGVCSYATKVSDTLRRRTEGLQRCRLHATRRITGAPASMQEAPGCSDSLGLLRMHYGSQRHAHGNAHGCRRSEGPRTRQIGTHGAQPHSCSRTVNRLASHFATDDRALDRACFSLCLTWSHHVCPRTCVPSSVFLTLQDTPRGHRRSSASSCLLSEELRPARRGP